jgi:uncharacterized protein (TIGR02145 family)
MQFEDQCWMGENLNIGTRINGVTTSTNENGVNSTIEKYCYSDNEANCDLYGGIYQWSEAMGYSIIEETQGICPSGWHIPTYNQIEILLEYISNNAEYQCGGVKENISKSMASISNWTATSTVCAPGNNQLTNNTTGFNIYPAGGRSYTSGVFGNYGLYGYMWSSTISLTDSNKAYYRYLSNKSATGGFSAYFRSFGVAVRCLKNNL